jgi:viroplasmin and RNaseH domain-containing protein
VLCTELMTKLKFYAVKMGREGPKIYTTWDEVGNKIVLQCFAAKDFYSARRMQVASNKFCE